MIIYNFQLKILNIFNLINDKQVDDHNFLHKLIQ